MCLNVFDIAILILWEKKTFEIAILWKYTSLNYSVWNSNTMGIHSMVTYMCWIDILGYHWTSFVQAWETLDCIFSVIENSFGKSLCFMGVSTISMVIFNSYVSHYRPVNLDSCIMLRFFQADLRLQISKAWWGEQNTNGNSAGKTTLDSLVTRDWASLVGWNRAWSTKKKDKLPPNRRFLCFSWTNLSNLFGDDPGPGLLF